ncbi:hypothetical protein CQW23_17226 [Capsicum baccatum]|uniref:Smr domain-containing protein n=1 Tax=Capsicum baccatum TaxID=33114 RepID=A0A2G2WD79_CAPBA|nr:hypothetical protein CQW23_17226 [Capsicum baccatum]
MIKLYNPGRAWEKGLYVGLRLLPRCLRRGLSRMGYEFLFCFSHVGLVLGGLGPGVGEVECPGVVEVVEVEVVAHGVVEEEDHGHELEHVPHDCRGLKQYVQLKKNENSDGIPDKSDKSGFEKLPSFGCEPDDVTYSVMIDCYDAMTFATLIRIYGAAGNFDGCLNVYEEMKALGVKPNMTVYNRLLDAMGRARRPSQAKNIYAEMLGMGFNQVGVSMLHSFELMVSEVESILNEMMEAGFDPNIFVLTSLIQCYGKAGWSDDVVRTFDRPSDLRLSADEQFTGCPLNVLTLTAKEDLHKLTICRERANPKLGYVVKLLVDEKKAYCNCLSDICVNLNQLERACELLDVGLTLNIYKDIMSQNATQWSLHLKSLSLGAALTALLIWMNDLNKALESGEEFPSLLGINTGHGKHKYSDKGLAGVFESHLKELNAPFHEAPDHAGWFLTTKVAATSWLESRRAQVVAS